jgi:DNA-binding MarR family transcriptional regulator
MDQRSNDTDHKLTQALMQFKQFGWHEHSIAGCTPSEIRVLVAIKKGGNAAVPHMTVSEISKHLHVTPPSITHLLNSLEGRGLIERHMDKADRRVIVVTLTRQGEDVTKEAKEVISTNMKGLIDDLGEEQSNLLADLLFQVYHYFGEREAVTHREL